MLPPFGHNLPQTPKNAFPSLPTTPPPMYTPPSTPLQPDLLEDLLAQLQALHPHLDFPPIPERGDLQLYRVRHSKYFFA